jgi:NAD(P)-dependent dehydrogenase (short-subunit alcohol dehydrogenase family)
MTRLGDSLSGKRVLITQASEFMGPALVEVFREHGAEVHAQEGPLAAPGAVRQAVDAEERIDVLIANLGVPVPSTCAAARGARVSHVRAVGAEVAASNVRVNLIAQNFVESPTYHGPEVQALPAFQERLRREVPAGRLASPREDALFAVFLASGEVNFFAGRSFPFAGGWVS